MTVIPAIDLLNRKVVRLYKGDYKQAVIYNDNPLEEAGVSHIFVIGFRTDVAPNHYK